MRPLRLAAALVAVLALRPVAAEPEGVWKLVFSKVQVDTWPAGTTIGGEPSPSTPQEARSVVVALLARSWLSIREGDDEHIYDFKARRIRHVDHAHGTARDVSLFADIGFRDAEIRNRVMLGKALRAVDAQDASLDPVNDETDLCVEADFPASPLVEVESTEGLRVFRVDGQPRVKIRSATTDLPQDFRSQLLHFLLYGAQLHPDVLRRLSAEARVPAMLTYEVTHTKNTTVSLELRESEASTVDIQAQVAAFRPAPETDSRIGDLAARVLRGELGREAPTFEEYRTRASDALRSGHNADALLAQLESMIAIGRVDSELVQEIASKSSDDKRVQAILIALRTTDQAESLPLFDAIESQDLQQIHVLEVFQGNAAAAAKDMDRSFRHFRKALTANPFLVGAYKDVGGILYEEYDTGLAWQCWDAARKIDPRHPMLEAIDRLEAGLVKKYPSFF